MKAKARLGAALVKVARGGDRGIFISDPSPEIAKLVERGFVRLSRRAPGERQNTSSRQYRTHAYITEAGWVAVWTEDLGEAKPVPKSERIERDSHRRRR